MATRSKTGGQAARAQTKNIASIASAADRDTALYLYGITQASDSVGAAVSQPGIDGSAPVKAIALNGFLCWVSRVSRKEFAEPLQERMEDIDWLAAAGLRHQRVVGELARQAETLPARFGAIFLSEESLQKDIKSRRAELNRSFRLIAAADEWGVKIFRAPRPAIPRMPAVSGSDYLRHKAQELSARQERVDRELPAKVQSLAAELKRMARAVAPGGQVSSGQADLAWQAAVLLPRKAKARFDRAVRRFAQASNQAYRIEVTGPWPPYSFVRHGR